MTEARNAKSAPVLRRIEVLAVSGTIDPRVGGPPATAKDMWLAASRSGIAVSVAVCVRDPPLEDETCAIEALRRLGVETRCFPQSRLCPRLASRWGVSLPLAPWIFRAAGRSDIVQVHGAYVFSSIVAGIAARLNRRPLVVVPHESLTDFDVRDDTSPLRRILKGLLKRWLVGIADALVFASQLERRDSVSEAQTAKSAVLYHPACDERQQRHARRRWPARLPSLRVGYLGRLDPKKNLELLIEAVAAMPEARLSIAGDGPAEYRARLVDLARRHDVGYRVEWLGFLAASQKEAFFASIDVLAMPSQYECFGRAAAEALVHGVPAIVSERTGIAEVIARHGCGLVVPADTGSVHAAIRRLAEEPALLEEFSQRAIRASAEELSLGCWGEAIARLYRRLAPG